ncbi:MAG: helix-turn-helix transcriptional regulator [Flavobacteriaceae bacterium]|nr:helix-turn-helix transcriptional regulator [Flavobacteriaceae bacterium]NNK61474.1 helix-turn-helix transcriptional regulator [Flavobacteriaceae bacterium]
MNLGNVIKNIRKQRGQTQEEFASLCGITQTYLSKIERNSKEPNLSTLKDISDAINVPLPILFFQSLTEDDVHPTKRKAFEEIKLDVNSLVNELYSI